MDLCLDWWVSSPYNEVDTLLFKLLTVNLFYFGDNQCVFEEHQLSRLEVEVKFPSCTIVSVKELFIMGWRQLILRLMRIELILFALLTKSLLHHGIGESVLETMAVAAVKRCFGSGLSYSLTEPLSPIGELVYIMV